jgi:hypothetical protein
MRRAAGRCAGGGATLGVGLSGRLIASYIVVTLAVVLVEGLALGFQVPALVNGAQLQSRVDATETYYSHLLSQHAVSGTEAYACDRWFCPRMLAGSRTRLTSGQIGCNMRASFVAKSFDGPYVRRPVRPTIVQIHSAVTLQRRWPFSVISPQAIKVKSHRRGSVAHASRVRWPRT